jgi:tetrahydromethanopterin S-methyltransferase subunit E
MEPLISMGILALIGATSTIAGASEELESLVATSAIQLVQIAVSLILHAI